MKEAELEQLCCMMKMLYNANEERIFSCRHGWLTKETLVALFVYGE